MRQGLHEGTYLFQDVFRVQLPGFSQDTETRGLTPTNQLLDFGYRQVAQQYVLQDLVQLPDRPFLSRPLD